MTPTTPPRAERSSDLDETRMITALVTLRQRLVEAELPFDLPGAEQPRADRAEMIDQLEDYVIPRLMTLEAPLLAVVGGSTGAGKSTLVNSIVGHRVTAPGVLRPTTRSPVLVHHPDDAHWFGQDRLLPDLTRVDHATDDPDSLQLVSSFAVDPGLAILDAPDVDSVEERNRTLSAQLLAAADLWLFVTSAARYADQVPWAYLKQAAERSTSVAIVLDRTPDEAIATVATHLARMLASRGLKDSPLFTVTEGKVDDQGLLPAGHVVEIRDWLDSLAGDADARTAVARQTLDGAVRAITRRSYPVADAVVGQREVAVRLETEVAALHDDARDRLLAAATDATLMRGDLLARWLDFAGSGDLLRSLESRVGGLRDRLVNTIKGKPQQAERVIVAAEAGVETLVLERAEAAAAASRSVWERTAAGAELLAASPDDLGRAARDLRRRAERVAREWQLEVTDLVRAAGSDRRMTARYLAFGVHGLSVALMVVVFSGASQAGQEARTLLDAVFGAGEVDRLVSTARGSLEQRLVAVMAGERRRYLSLVEGLALNPQIADQLRAAARRVDDLRFAANSHSSGETGP